MNQTYEKEVAVAVDLAKQAGAVMREHFGFNLAHDAQWKSDNTPLTVADTTINSFVIDRIKAEFPEHGVLGEEDSYEPKRPKVWVVDPIDGTQPYSVGSPTAGFSIALVEDGQAVVGVLYDPFMDRQFTAVRGQGAQLNGQPLHVKPQPLHYVSVGSRMSPAAQSNGAILDQFDELGIKWFNFRCFIYPVMLLVAGTISAAIMGNPKPWDIAACGLIVTEAGGRVTDLLGNDMTYDQVDKGCLMSDGRSHEQLLSILKP